MILTLNTYSYGNSHYDYNNDQCTIQKMKM